MTSFGRPIKYADLVNKLKGYHLYSPASIAHFGNDIGYFDGLSDEDKKRKVIQIRLALGKLKTDRAFPEFGDGTIRLKHQSPSPAWHGWRWQLAVNYILPDQNDWPDDCDITTNQQNHVVSNLDRDLATALNKTGSLPIRKFENLLQVDLVYLIAACNRMEEKNLEPKERIGIVRQNGIWLAKMERFGPWYLKKVHNKVIRRVPFYWGTNKLLDQRGLFLLGDVCKHIPFTSGQIKHHINKFSDPRGKFGVWAASDGAHKGNYLVDMAVFGPYLKGIWTASTAATLSVSV